MAKKRRLSYLLTKKDKGQLFFYAYYTYPGWGWVRSLAGPILAVLGAFVANATTGAPRIIGGVFVGYGFYYSAKPALHFFLTRKKQVDSKETIELNDEAEILILRRNNLRLEIPYADLVRLKKTPFGRSLAFRLEGRTSRIFIPQNRIVEGKYDPFVEKLELLLMERRSGK